MVLITRYIRHLSDDAPDPGDVPTAALLHYTMETWEADGVTMLDESGSGHSGQKTGSASLISGGAAGKALSLAASGDGLSIESHELLFPRTQEQVSISCWFRTTQSGDGDIFRRAYSHGSLRIHHGGGSVGFEAIVGGSVENLVSAPDGWNDGFWHHVTAIYDRSALKLSLYLDGSLDSSKTIPDGDLSYDSDPDYTTQIGHTKNNSGDVMRQYIGDVDDFRIYLRALSASEILALYGLGA